MSKRTCSTYSSATGMLLALLCISSPVSGSPSAETLMSVSGFGEQLDAVPKALNESFEQLLIAEGVAAPFEPEDVPILRQSVSSVFGENTLRDAVVNEIDAVMSEEDRQTLIQFYATPWGLAFRQSEIDNSILYNIERFTQWYESEGLESLSTDRQKAISALEQAMQATSGAVDTIIGMQVAMQVSISPVLPVEQRQSPAQLMREAQQQRSELTRIYQKNSLETLAFLYQDQPAQALHAYTKVLNSDAGQRYVKAVNEGMSRGLFNAAQVLGRSLREILSGRLGQSV